MTRDKRKTVLAAAFDVLESEGSVSLDSAAKKAGMTKAGLMHYFPSKEVLMLGLLDFVADRWETHLRSYLGGIPDTASPTDRIRAYVDFTLTGEFDRTDMVMLSDPRLRPQLTQRWAEQMARWFALPPNLDPRIRSRLISARLIADGAWFASSTEVFELDTVERQRVRDIAHELLQER